MGSDDTLVGLQCGEAGLESLQMAGRGLVAGLGPFGWGSAQFAEGASWGSSLERDTTAERRRKTALENRLSHELNHAQTGPRLFAMRNRLCGAQIDGQTEVLLYGSRLIEGPRFGGW